MLARQHIPNALTLLRLVLAAGFFVAIEFVRITPGAEATSGLLFWGNAAIVLFVLAAVTDALDGHLARRWNVVSMFGRIMDPFCDKVLVLGAFIYLAGPRFVVAEWAEAGRLFPTVTGIVPIMVVLILARELLVTGVRGVAESLGVAFPAQAAGKLKMILQSIGIPLILLLSVNFDPIEHGWVHTTNCSVGIAIVLVTLWSGWPYIAAVRTILVQTEESGQDGDRSDGARPAAPRDSEDVTS